MCGCLIKSKCQCPSEPKHQSHSAWLLNSSHELTNSHINGHNAMMWFHALVGWFLSLSVLIEAPSKLCVLAFCLDDVSQVCFLFTVQSCATWRSCCFQIWLVLNFSAVCSGSQNQNYKFRETKQIMDVVKDLWNKAEQNTACFTVPLRILSATPRPPLF